MSDPFDALRDQLVIAAGGQPPRRRSGPIALAAVIFVLVAAAAAAALMGRDEPEPRARTTPTPSPTSTPTPTPTSTLPPAGTPQPPSANSPGYGAPAPGTVPAPGLPGGALNYEVEVTPNLAAGEAGWCVGVILQSVDRVRGRHCTRAGSPDEPLIAIGALLGRSGLLYMVVDRRVVTVELSDGRRLAPRRDPALPPAWRVAVFGIQVVPGGRVPTVTLLDVNGNHLSTQSLTSRGRLPTHKIPANDPPHEHCAIRPARGSHLHGSAARLLTRFETLNVVRPSFLSCASSTFRLGRVRFRAAVLVNARDSLAPAPSLPAAPHELSAKRAGAGWLVVLGGNARQRQRVLNRLSVVGP